MPDIKVAICKHICLTWKAGGPRRLSREFAGASTNTCPPSLVCLWALVFCPSWYLSGCSRGNRRICIRAKANLFSAVDEELSKGNSLIFEYSKDTYFAMLWEGFHAFFATSIFNNKLVSFFSFLRIVPPMFPMFPRARLRIVPRIIFFFLIRVVRRRVKGRVLWAWLHDILFY